MGLASSILRSLGPQEARPLGQTQMYHLTRCFHPRCIAPNHFMRPFRTQVVALPYKCSISKFQIDSFQSRWYKKQRPVKYDCRVFAKLNKLPALTKWIKPHTHSVNRPFLGPYELNYEHLDRYGHVTVPIERTVWANEGKSWDVKSFEKFEAPLSFFLEWTRRKLAEHHTFCPNESLYIAQCPINTLPKDLWDDLPAPVYCTRHNSAVSKKLRKHMHKMGDESRPALTEASSIWMGIPPTETPLHRDPNSNFLVQVAGFKTLRLVKPELGQLMLAYAKREVAMQQNAHNFAGGLGMGMRGEEMMVGPERALMSELVWRGSGKGVKCRILQKLENAEVEQESTPKESEGAQQASDDDIAASNNTGSVGDDSEDIRIWEITLSPGDALFIPQGWYHSVRSLGSIANGINVSANWWFRFKDRDVSLSGAERKAKCRKRSHRSY